jgi:hypothetical protein
MAIKFKSQPRKNPQDMVAPEKFYGHLSCGIKLINKILAKYTYNECLTAFTNFTN